MPVLLEGNGSTLKAGAARLAATAKQQDQMREDSERAALHRAVQQLQQQVHAAQAQEAAVQKEYFECKMQLSVCVRACKHA